MQSRLNEKVEEPSSCCGGPAPENVDACCVKDADAKSKGEEGCGCNSDEQPKTQTGGCCS